MKIESFEKACEKLGQDPEKVLPDVSSFPERHQKALIANAKLILIAEAAQDGWKPDWNNISERKWFPWFDMEVDDNNPSGFRFDVTYCVISTTYSTSGSRLCFKSEEDAEFHGKHHLELYRDMMVIGK
jgi:hypothetical protein